MAMPLGVMSTFFSGETASFSKSALSLTSLRHLPPPSPHTNLRLVRTVTSAAASKPPAAATGKREPRGIMKPRRISPEMQDFLGVPEIPRTQALKQIWAYIKQHNLQVLSINPFIFLSNGLSVKLCYC